MYDTQTYTQSFHATAVVFAQNETQVDKKFESKCLQISIEFNFCTYFTNI